MFLRSRQIAWTALCAVGSAGCIAGTAARNNPAREGEDISVYSISDTTVVLAPGIVSTGNEFAPSISADGRSIYFVRRGSNQSDTEIYMSRFQANVWSPPRRVTLGSARETDPYVSPNGKSLYFAAPRRRGATPTESDGDLDIWVAAIGLGEGAERVTSLANTDADERHPSVTADGTIFFARHPRGNANRSELFYFSRQLRTTAAPVLIGKEVLNPDTPFIRYDGRVLIFSATSALIPESRDIFVTRRGGDGRWSTPASLGREINTRDEESSPYLSPDERFLFFTRSRVGGDGRMISDILVTPISSVPVLRDALR